MPNKRRHKKYAANFKKKEAGDKSNSEKSEKAND